MGSQPPRVYQILLGSSLSMAWSDFNASICHSLTHCAHRLNRTVVKLFPRNKLATFMWTFFFKKKQFFDFDTLGGLCWIMFAGRLVIEPFKTL